MKRWSLSTNIFPSEAVPNNHTPPDNDIERSLCVELDVVVDWLIFLFIFYLYFNIFFFCWSRFEILKFARPLNVIPFSPFVQAILFLVDLYLFLLFQISTGGHLDVNLVVTAGSVSLTAAYFVSFFFFFG